MLRIKDPKKSLEFYRLVFHLSIPRLALPQMFSATNTASGFRDHLGMTVVQEKHFPEWKFSLYFLATLPKGTVIPKPGTPECGAWLHGISGTVLELTQ